MRYIDVLSRFKYTKSKYDPIPLIVDQADGILISLANVSKLTTPQNKSSYFTLDTDDIVDFKEKYIQQDNRTLWVDSGGFNLLSNWNLNDDSLNSYIDNYYNYAVNNKRFAKIFSLDLPPAVKKKKVDNRWINTPENIKKWNIESHTRIVDELRLSKSFLLRENFYFVYHFRTLGLYKIWNEIYEEFDLDNILYNRAIGGLVGIYAASRKANKKELLFSPVIGPAFKCFHDYLKSTHKTHDFILHFLGVSTPLDQFVIIFLEKLFTYYLSERGHQRIACFSVDTRSHSYKMDVFCNVKIPTFANKKSSVEGGEFLTI